MRLYLPSLMAFAAELGTSLRCAVRHRASRPEPPAIAGAWVIPRL